MRSMTKLLPSLRLLAAAALWTVPQGPALAGDGVLEINQSCAAVGCFAGDTAGFPVTITTPGSYRLTSNLTVADANTRAISLTTGEVSIDLNGFAIRGPVTCSGSGSSLACTPSSGSGGGINTTNTTFREQSVRNGSITGMGGRGVEIGYQGEVVEVRARWNLGGGIYANNGSALSGCTAHENLGEGIIGGSGSVVSGSSAYANSGRGIVIGYAGTVTANTAYLNGEDGIWTNYGATISNNSAYSNAGNGIQAYSGSTVQGNTARQNTGYGLNVLSQAAYRDNTVSGNIGGTVGGTGTNMGGNSCNGTATCP